jgi:isoleucyl-tRNA synthetase
MREQIRLWFYSQLFMSVALVGRAPFKAVLGYEKMLDEQGREMHGSWGNLIAAEEAFERMGADVMRWQYCQQPPDRNLLFGYGPAHEIKRRLLTLWNSATFLIRYANTPDVQFAPRVGDLESGPRDATLQPLDRWLLARTQSFLGAAEAGYEAYLTGGVTRALEEYVDDLSNWYIRRSRRRFWEDADDAAFRTLWYALVQALRAISPIMPFLAEHLWQILVAKPLPDAPQSVFLAGWPSPVAVLADETLVADMAETRSVIELGRSARNAAAMKLRQPLAALVVEGASAGPMRLVEQIAGELRVKEVRFGPIEGATLRAKPNLPLLGPKLGQDLPAVREALAEGRFERLPGGGVQAVGHELSAEEVFVERSAPDGFALAEDAGLIVALDIRLDDDLRLESRALDLIHEIQNLRKEQGLELTDRIVIGYQANSDVAGVLDRHGDWVARETLAVRLEPGAGSRLEIDKG